MSTNIALLMNIVAAAFCIAVVIEEWGIVSKKTTAWFSLCGFLNILTILWLLIRSSKWLL